MKSKSTTAVLAFFLGGFGAHRFYLGQTGFGILYFIFCWTLIPAVIALVDFVVFVSISEETFNAKYNNKRTSANINTADELEKFYSLKEKGIISEAEFQNRKSQLI